MKVLQSLFLASIISLFTACGGGGGGTTSTDPVIIPSTPPTTQYVSGVAIDGYISGATVCIDTTLNNSCDDESSTKITTTDANGSFSFDSSLLSDDSVIIAYGGTDENGAFNHIVKNIASNKTSDGKIALTALTTLVTEYVLENNSTLTDAKSKISAYAKEANSTLISEDYIDNSYSILQATNLKIFKIIEIINTDGQINKTNSNIESAKTFRAIVKTITDDASGLSIADKLRTQKNSLAQSVSNGNSAIAMIQIADKAMSEQSNILDVVKTKLLQAATELRVMEVDKL